MSLIGALTTATSGLRAVQTQIGVISNNLTNADVPNYTQKSVTTQSVVEGGQGVGITVTAITSNVDQNLLKAITIANSVAGASGVKSTYLSNAESSLGTTSSQSSIGNQISTMQSAVAKLASNPESLSQRTLVVSAAQGVASSLSSMTSSIQTLRGQADQQIATNVGTINTDLTTIDDLNHQILRTKASGEPTADLEDQRNKALGDLSTKIDINYYTDGNGRTLVYTGSGSALVDGSAHKLAYTPASSVSANVTYGGMTGFQGINLNGRDITGSVQSGELKGLIDLRDTDLVAQQNQVSNLSSTLAATVNAASNAGTAFPPPNSLTGSASVAATDSFSGSGTVRVAVLGSDGSVQSSQDLNLSSYSTVGQVVTALNGVSGLSASIDSTGKLKVTASSGASGVSIGAGTSNVGGKSFSSYFGLNDLFVSNGPGKLAVRSDIAATPSLLPTAGLSTATPLSPGASGLAAGDTTIATAIGSALGGATSFAPAGGIGATTASFGDYAATIVSNIATASANAQATGSLNGDTVTQLTTQNSNESGVNTDQETAELTVLQNSYSATANVVTTVEKMFASLMSMFSGA